MTIILEDVPAALKPTDSAVDDADDLHRSHALRVGMFYSPRSHAQSVGTINTIEIIWMLMSGQALDFRQFFVC